MSLSWQSLQAVESKSADGQREARVAGLLRVLRTYPTLVLLIGAFGIELFIPFLVSMGAVPGALGNLSHLAIGGIVAVAFLTMLLWDRLPGAFLVVLGITVVSVVVAVYEGQPVSAIVWGWWLLFKYPLVGLFVFLQRRWPAALAGWLFRLCMGLLVLELVVQAGQYVAGEPPGDNLAGTFGDFATPSLLSFVLFALALAIGRWLATSDWRPPAFALVLGAVSSALGEMKFFVPAALLLIGVGIGLYLLFGRSGRGFVLYLIGVLAAFLGFFVLYNYLIVPQYGTPPIEEYISGDTTTNYLEMELYDPYQQTYILGRSFVTRYVWDSVQRDATTVLFGYGVGARTHSKALGIIGNQLRDSYYGESSIGTSFVVLLQELGIFGVAMFGLILLWICLTLLQFARQTQVAVFQTLSFGLMLYSLLWPLLLWYTESWTFGVANLLYWGSVGYLFFCKYFPERIDGLDALLFAPPKEKITSSVHWRSTGDLFDELPLDQPR